MSQITLHLISDTFSLSDAEYCTQEHPVSTVGFVCRLACVITYSACLHNELCNYGQLCFYRANYVTYFIVGGYVTEH